MCAHAREARKNFALLVGISPPLAIQRRRCKVSKSEGNKAMMTVIPLSALQAQAGRQGVGYLLANDEGTREYDFG